MINFFLLNILEFVNNNKFIQSDQHIYDSLIKKKPSREWI